MKALSLLSSVGSEAFDPLELVITWRRLASNLPYAVGSGPGGPLSMDDFEKRMYPLLDYKSREHFLSLAGPLREPSGDMYAPPSPTVQDEEEPPPRFALSLLYSMAWIMADLGDPSPAHIELAAVSPFVIEYVNFNQATTNAWAPNRWVAAVAYLIAREDIQSTQAKGERYDEVSVMIFVSEGVKRKLFMHWEAENVESAFERVLLASIRKAREDLLSAPSPP